MKWHWLVCWMIGVCSAGNLCSAQTLVTVEGQRMEGEIASISEAGEVWLAGRDRPAALQGLRAMERGKEAGSGSLFVQRLYLADGSVVVARRVTMGEGVVKFDWLGGEGARLPAAEVRGILLAPISAREGGEAGPEEPFAKAVRDEGLKQDVLLAIGEEGLTGVTGAMESLNEKQARFVWNGQAREIDRGKVYGVVLAAMGEPADLTGRVCVVLSDGSKVWGKLKTLKDGKLTLARAEGEMVLGWEHVVRVKVNSERMVFVSELDASEEKAEATVTHAWGLRKDASVMGGELRIGEARFERGLGVHARSALMYEIGGKYAKFAVTIGLDGEAGSPGTPVTPGSSEGDCVFVVKGDGKELMRRRMRAGEEGKAMLLDVGGVKRLELIVEEGENLDIGDCADWADARLIR